MKTRAAERTGGGGRRTVPFKATRMPAAYGFSRMIKEPVWHVSLILSEGVDIRYFQLLMYGSVLLNFVT